MKRFLALAALLLFSTFAFSQDFDFQLDPIENETITPTTYDLQAGNYAGKLLKIDLFEAQIEGQLKEDIYIFIIDTGIDFDHPFLRKIIMKKYARSFVPQQLVDDKNSHGTHVAGCGFAYSENIRLGTGQILSKNRKAHIIPLKGLTNAGQGNYSWIESSVDYSRETAKKLPGKKMIIMSLGGGSASGSLAESIQDARDEGIFVLVAAGNTGGTPVQFPGRAKGATACASTDNKASRSYFSSYGKEIVYAGPGEHILSTIPGGGTGKKSGTSMTVPVLAGAIALYMSMHPDATVNQIEQAFAANCTDILPAGRDELTGFGIPKFGLWIFEDPAKYPDEPVGWLKDDTNPELRREKRILTFNFYDVKLLWKTIAEIELNEMKYDVVVSFETDLYDIPAWKKMDEIIEWYSTHSAVVVRPEHGFVDATYYGGGFFLELIGNRNYDLNFTVENVTGFDEERAAIVRGKELHKKSLRKNSVRAKKLKRMPTGAAYTFELNK